MIWRGIVPSAAVLLDPCSSPTVRIIRSGFEGGDLPEGFVYNVYVDSKPHTVHLALAPVPVLLHLSAHWGSPINCPFETLLAAQELTNQLFRNSVYRRSLQTRCPLLRRMARPSELRHSALLTRFKDVGWNTQNRVPLEFSQRLNGLFDPEQPWSRLGTPSGFNACGWPHLGYNDCRQFYLTRRMSTGIPK